MNFADVEILRRVFRKLVVSKGYSSLKETTTYINYKCPHCDDTQSRKRVGRAFFTVKLGDKGWRAHFTCHNGGCDFNDPVGAIRYLKKYHPSHFDEFKNESNKDKNSFKFSLRNRMKANRQGKKIDGGGGSIDWDKHERDYRAKIEKEEREQKEKDKEAMKHFISINKPSILRNTAIKFCEDRLIPKSVYKKFFVATKGKYRNYLIIPYFKKDGKPAYFQARALYDYVTPKYKNRVGSKQPYNIDFVDPTKDVIAFEGALDSIFVENAFALGGVSVNEEIRKRFDPDKLFFVGDNDVAGRTQAKKLIDQGYNVFNWNRFLITQGLEPTTIKDWNDLVKITKKTFWKTDEIIEFFIKKESK